MIVPPPNGRAGHSGAGKDPTASDLYVRFPTRATLEELREFLLALPEGIERICLVVEQDPSLDQAKLTSLVQRVRAASVVTPVEVLVGYQGSLENALGEVSDLEPKGNRFLFDLIYLTLSPSMVKRVGEEGHRLVFATLLAAVNLWESVVLVDPFVGLPQEEPLPEQALAPLVESARTWNGVFMLLADPLSPSPFHARQLVRLGAGLVLGSGAKNPDQVGKYGPWEELVRELTVAEDGGKD